MDKILADSRLRRQFSTVVVLVIISLSVVRWAYLSDLQQQRLDDRNTSAALDALARIIEGLASSLLVAFALALFLYWSNRDVIKATEENEIIAASQINARFKSAQGDTTTWYFKGSLGRFFTADDGGTVPSLLSTKKNGLHLFAQVVDPFNPNLCKFVSKCRAGAITPARVRVEALATVVDYVRLVQNRDSQVTIARCRLVDDYLPFRVDAWDGGVFVTHDDASAPALFHCAGSAYHDGRLQELTLTMTQGRHFDVRDLATNLLVPEVERSKVDDTYVAAVVQEVMARTSITGTLAQGEAAEVAKAIRERKSPY